MVNKFTKGLPVKISLVASHGHTIFHRPSEKITFQLGDGYFIAAETKITTVSDFRTFDVALGGQGAPLVPVGDEHLFPNYDFCLNLGGFANVSYSEYGKRIAFDICPVNFAINFLSNEAGKEFDKDGFLAMKGKTDKELLEKLNKLDFYKIPAPKSLGREWFENQIIPLISDKNIKLEDRLRTFYEHVAIQISDALKREKQKSVLTTGGGALNKFLVQIIKEHSSNQYVIPGNEIIEFKEAIVFAFLGVLRIRNEINVFSSATGSRCDSCSGVIHKIN
jgi:anhydro-N-acetylmuramic acid kinase